MSTAMVPQLEGAGGQVVSRQEFGAVQIQRQAETAMAAVTAREQAAIQAEYVMAERHPRNWQDVRAAMLDHCSRPRFADISRYAKPVGKAKVNGEWVENYARGFSARFTEVLAQEMGNLRPWSQVTYEDDMIRIVRFGVTDLQKNLTRSREVTFAKVVEKRGKQDRKSGAWQAPEGREVISQRVNSYGDPVYLVKATEDEMRSKVNSEESKTQRDFIARLCPRDVLEDCEDRIRETTAAADAKDPLAARKKILDRFHEFSLMPSDLEQYIGRPATKWTAADLSELRDLGVAIRDGQTTFDDALRAKYATPDGEMGSAKAAAEVAESKIAAAETIAASNPPQARPVNTQSDPITVPTTMPVAQHSEPPASFEGHVMRFDSWNDIEDQTDTRLGLKVEIGGVLYTRGDTSETWTRATGQRTKPQFGRRS